MCPSQEWGSGVRPPGWIYWPSVLDPLTFLSPFPHPGVGLTTGFLSWAARVKWVRTYGMLRAKLEQTFKKCSNQYPRWPCNSVSKRGPFCPGKTWPGQDSPPIGRLTVLGKVEPTVIPATLHGAEAPQCRRELIQKINKMCVSLVPEGLRSEEECLNFKKNQ